MSFEEVCVMDQIWKRIEAVAEQNNGFIRTSQVEELGISRPMLEMHSVTTTAMATRNRVWDSPTGMPREDASWG